MRKETKNSVTKKELYGSLAFLYLLVVLIVNDFSINNFLFQSAGLWDKVGSDFTKALLFELPFVIIRVLPFIICAGISIYYMIKEKKNNI